MSQSPLDKPSVTEQVRRAAADDREAWDDLLNAHRARLCKMVAVRLDHRLQAGLDLSDVIQEAFVDATAGFAEFAARQEMPFFLWRRWLTGMRLSKVHRKLLQNAIRNAVRDVPLEHAGALGDGRRVGGALCIAGPVRMPVPRRVQIGCRTGSTTPTRP